MTTVSYNSYAVLVEKLLKGASSPADLAAGLYTISAGSTPQDKLDASVNFLKMYDALHTIVKGLPFFGTILNGTSFLSNLNKASNDLRDLGYISEATQRGMIGDVLAVVSAGGFAAAAGGVVVAGLSAPVLIAISADSPEAARSTR